MCVFRLQQFFNNHVLLSEQAEYKKEAIVWDAIDIPDNQGKRAL